MTDATIRKQVFLKANKATVWAYLTDREKLAIWFHKPPETLAEGKDYEMFGTESGNRLIWGRVTAARPHEYLEYSFTVRMMPDVTGTVKWTLEDAPGGTRLSLEHSGVPATREAFEMVLSLDKGWEDHIARMRTEIHETQAS